MDEIGHRDDFITLFPISKIWPLSVRLRTWFRFRFCWRFGCFDFYFFLQLGRWWSLGFFLRGLVFFTWLIRVLSIFNGGSTLYCLAQFSFKQSLDFCKRFAFLGLFNDEFLVLLIEFCNQFSPRVQFQSSCSVLFTFVQFCSVLFNFFYSESINFVLNFKRFWILAKNSRTSSKKRIIRSLSAINNARL